MNHLHPVRTLFFLGFCLSFCFVVTACSKGQKEITLQCEKLIEQLNSVERSKNPQKVSILSRQLLETASRIHSKKDRQIYEGLAYFDLGQIQSDKKDFGKAEEYYRKSFASFSNDSIRELDTKAMAALGIARCQMKQENKEEMFHWIHLADQCFESLQFFNVTNYNDVFVSYQMEKIFILHDAHELERADCELQKVVAFYQEKQNTIDKVTQSNLFFLQGIIAFQKHKYDDCIRYMKFAIDHFHDKKGFISFGHHKYILDSYLCKKDFQEALDFTNRLMKDDTFYSNDQKRKQYMCNYFLAKIYDVSGNPQEAKKYAGLALKQHFSQHWDKELRYILNKTISEFIPRQSSD